MTVYELMTKELVCCEIDTSLYEASKLMADFDVGDLPVVEQYESRKLAGVITDRDIVCRSVAKGLNVYELQVRQVMTSPPLSVTSEDSAETCLDMMEKNKVRRLPVVDRERRCLGIITQSDLVRAMPQKGGRVVKAVSLK